MTTLHELEERILRLEKQNRELKRARKGLIVEPALNILGQNTRIDGNLYLGGNAVGVWQDWTPTQTGWTALPPGVYRYCVIGKHVTLSIAMSAGTSNDTSASLSLPITAKTILNLLWMGANGYAMNNGTTLTTASRWRISSGTNVIDFFTNMYTGTWINSGVKRVYCVATYEID